MGACEAGRPNARYSMTWSRRSGADVEEDGRGVLRDDRMYQLVRQGDAVRDRTLEITFLEPGAEAYAFTFG